MPKSHRRNLKPESSRWSQLLIVSGLVLLVIFILLQKDKPAESAIATVDGDLPSMQIERALEEHQPVLAFFHSNNCQQCIEMIAIVEQVYPEFTDSVVLVDVNVYDERNEPLLRQVGLQYIPTLIFYDRDGQSQVSIGVMKADVLRQTMVALSEGE